MVILFIFLIMTVFLCVFVCDDFFFVCLVVTLFVCPIYDDFFCIFICNDHLCIPSYDLCSRKVM
jgi:hypothetical protein